MSERDPDQLADQLDEEADKLERRSEELGSKVQDVRDDWERKRADPGVPGAVPRPKDEASPGDQEREPDDEDGDAGDS
jgi:hypothetical protein